LFTGLWQFSGDADKVAARMGMGKTGRDCATLSDVIQQINEIDHEKTASLNDQLPEMVKAEPGLEVEKVDR
jgi:hypothetical protein